MDALGGIPALSAKIHSMGLKFGVYNDVGRGTCAGNPGLNVSMDSSSDAQLQRDVALMAHKWQIDSIKVVLWWQINSIKVVLQLWLPPPMNEQTRQQILKKESRIKYKNKNKNTGWWMRRGKLDKNGHYVPETREISQCQWQANPLHVQLVRSWPRQGSGWCLGLVILRVRFFMFVLDPLLWQAGVHIFAKAVWSV